MALPSIEIKVDQIFEAISRIKIPYLTIFLAFLSTYALWFLSVYFLSPTFFLRHGVIVSLIAVFGLTVPWILISMMYVPKEMAFYALRQLQEKKDSLSFLESQRAIVNFYIFANAVLLQGFFLYLSYLFRWSLFTLVSVAFWTFVTGYFVIDIAAKHEYNKHLKARSDT